jgi:hypothetical protein
MKPPVSFKATQKGKRFLGVRYINCASYGRLYENDEKTAYVGSCPRCGKRYQVRIGEGGTDSRMFLASC